MIDLFSHQHTNQRKDASTRYRTVAAKKRLVSAMILTTLAFGAAVLIGCSHPGGPGSKNSSGGGSGPAVDITGNWQIEFTPTHSPAPISSLAGYLSQQGSGNSEFTTASLQAQTSGCFTDASTVPMSGQISGNGLGLTSFAIDGQTLSIDAQATANGNQFSGKYTITGGCAGGAAGTVAGTEYAPLTGTYTGSITGSSPAVTLSLSLSQDAGGTGLGTFPLSGSAAFTGISCFSQGTLGSQDGNVIGDSVTMDFATSQGADVQMSGTFDPAASTITLSSIQIAGSSCSGSLGAATLTRQ